MNQPCPYKETIRKAMHECGYDTLTPVQEKCIPLLLSGRQILVQSETGSGKTAAFLIPSLQMIEENDRQIQILIIEPTRELALQTGREAERLAVYTGIHTSALVGGMDITKQINRLHQGLQLVTGTPGRLNDLLHQNELDLSHLKYVILDEADQILSTGQKEETNALLMHCHCRMALFSATLNEDVRSFLLGDATEVIMNQSSLNSRITPYYIRAEEKKETLIHLLKHLPVVSAIVFVKYKEEAAELADALKKEHILTAPFSSYYQERTRIRTLRRFENGDIRVLVATDAAARGLDIQGVSHIIHYDLPEDPALFIHRSGRSAHQFNTGTVLVLLSSSDALTPMGRTILQSYDEAAIPEEPNDLSRPLHPHKKKQPDVMRILLRAGKKQKMRPKDIIGALCTYVNFKDIGVLDIQDNYSTVTILKNDPSLLERLDSLTIKGKKVKAEPLKEK
jgi:superfamily II DNA/RNA helicase